MLGLAGGFLLFHPWLGSPQCVSGTGFLACGAFVFINADSLLAFWGMATEVTRLRQRVVFFKTRLRKQLQKLTRLRQSDVAFQEFEERFDGSAIVAKHYLPKLKEEIRDTILQNTSNVCRFFIDEDPDRLVRVGRELGEAMRIFGAIFRNEFPDFDHRCALLHEGLQASSRFHEDGGVKCETLIALVGDSLAQEDVFAIPSRTLQKIGQSDAERLQIAVAAVDALE